MVLVGYSFGAAIAVVIDRRRAGGWFRGFLVAPPLRSLVPADQCTIAN